MRIEPAHRLAPLLRWPFLLALGLLILNDAVLKSAWHNAFTGKLSDFAGVFAFAYFWAVAIGRGRMAVHGAVGLAFVWWKSSWSTSAIDAWNGLPLFDVARVVDYGDLWALAVLPLSWWCLARGAQPNPRDGVTPAWPQLAVAAIALVAFTATSRPLTTMTIKGGVVYLVPLSPEQMLQRSRDYLYDERHDPELYPVGFDWSDCAVTAEFELHSADAMTQMTLRKFTSRSCDIRDAKPAELFRAMQPELRSRLGARLLQPYAMPNHTELEARYGGPPRCCEADEEVEAAKP